MAIQRVKHPEKLGDRLADPDELDASFVVLHDGWVEDLERLHASITAHHGAHDWELVVVDNPVTDEATERIAALERVAHVPLVQKVGYGGGRNLGLRLARGRVVLVVDTSVEATGDVVAPVERALGEGAGLAGRWGVSTNDGFHFEESDGPDVDGVEAYLMATRRVLLREVGLFDAKFRWYRNADLDFSFRVRAAGLRTVVVPGLPVVRHEHRLWNTTPEAEREQLSKKNFWRFREHWGERDDLFVAKRA